MPTDRPRRIGRYEVRDRIGQGGMGVLWLAWDPRLQRLVAIKQLWTQNPEVRRRFLREASVAGKLQHPHIVTVYDTAEHDGQPFIAMEYIKGKTVAHLIRTRTAGPIADRLRLMIDLCDGLAFAHRAGVIHRDVKPANLMLNEEGQLKILDFGIARVLDASLTQDGVALGTPNYMSPEQVQGRPVDHRSDIFAVGLVLYELLTYRQAFPGESHHMVALTILQDEPEPLLRLMPGLDVELAEIVARCLHKQPDDRYQDLLEMRRDLEDVRDGLVQASTEDTVSVRPPGVAPPPPATPTPPRFDAEILKRRRQELIERHLATADNALREGRFEDAQDAVEAAATLDPDHAGVMALHARVRTAVARRTAETFAAEARGLAASGSLTEALRRLTDAERIHPVPAELADLRREIAAKVEARDRERARARAFKAALDRAHAARQAGNLDAALAAVDEALGNDAADQSALELREAVVRALADRQRLESEARLVARSVAASDDALARDDVESASAALDACGEIAHPDLDAARVRVRERAAVLASNRREEKKRQQEAERQRLARERWIGEQCALAVKALDSDDPDLAVTILDAVVALGGEVSEARVLRDQALRVQQDKRRLEQVGQLAANAADLLAKGEPERAVALLAQARELSPADGALKERYEEARRAADEAEARRKAEAHDRAAHDTVRQATLEFERGQRAGAIDRLRRFAPAHEAVTAELSRLEEEAARLERAEREAAEQERQRRIDEAARAAVAAADEAFDRDEKDALERLRAFGPPHPLVEAAIERLAAASVVREQERAEAERRRQAAMLEQAARRAADAARRDFARNRQAVALEALRAFTPAHRIVTETLAELETEVARLRTLEEAAAERARLEREARERTAREAAEAISEAKGLFAAGRRDEAIAGLTAFQGDAALVADALRELTALAERHAREEAERQRKAREEADRARRHRLESGAAHLRNGDLEAAQADVEWVLAQSPASPEAAELGVRVAQAFDEREARSRARAEAEAAIADAERVFAGGQHEEAVELLRRFRGDPALVAARLGELTEAAAWRKARTTHLDRARVGEQARQRADVVEALRTVVEGDRRTSRPPSDAADIRDQLERAVRAGWQARVSAAAAMVSESRWDEADAVLGALKAEFGTVPASWGGVIAEHDHERREAHALHVMVTAALREREEAERRQLEADRERERRARERKELFAHARRDFRAGLPDQGLRRLEAAAPRDDVAAAAYARLAAGMAYRARDQRQPAVSSERLGDAHAAASRASVRRIESDLARAATLAQEGRRARAIACVADALRVDPSHADARALMESLRVPVAPSPAWRAPRRALLLLWDAAVLSLRGPRRNGRP